MSLSSHSWYEANLKLFNVGKDRGFCILTFEEVLKTSVVSEVDV